MHECMCECEYVWKRREVRGGGGLSHMHLSHMLYICFISFDSLGYKDECMEEKIKLKTYVSVRLVGSIFRLLGPHGDIIRGPHHKKLLPKISISIISLSDPK
jgi:hypothetical protein